MILSRYVQLISKGGSYKTINGNTANMNTGSYAYQRQNVADQTNVAYYNSNYGYSWIDVGFGDTPVEDTDYNLESPCYNSGKLTVTGIQKLSKGPFELLNIVLNVRNDTVENQTVKEIGFFGHPSGGNGLESQTGLFLRKVLDDPVTIAPGESYSFNYILKVKNP